MNANKHGLIIHSLPVSWSLPLMCGGNVKLHAEKENISFFYQLKFQLCSPGLLFKKDTCGYTVPLSFWWYLFILKNINIYYFKVCVKILWFFFFHWQLIAHNQNKLWSLHWVLILPLLLAKPVSMAMRVIFVFYFTWIFSSFFWEGGERKYSCNFHSAFFNPFAPSISNFHK